MKFQKLTPNLVVRDVAASIEFYRSVLGFQPAITVPDQAPYVFGSVTSGSVEIFFNDQKAVAAEYPALGARPIGGSLTLFIEVEGIEEVLAAVQKERRKNHHALEAAVLRHARIRLRRSRRLDRYYGRKSEVASASIGSPILRPLLNVNQPQSDERLQPTASECRVGH
jgi:catechol 2,3-dioxygenase-like lactoylglutathione lyase family enzyme